MSNIDKPQSPLRRQMLQAMAATLGLSSLVPVLVRADVEKSNSQHTQSLLSSEQQALLHSLCDLMIPRTDTPGAVDAGVPEFLDRLVSSHFQSAHRQAFIRGLESFQQHVQTTYDARFVELPEAQRLARLVELDQLAFAAATLSPWQEFYKECKSLVLFGYYTSEAGATQELKYEAVPGIYRACVPLESIGRAWST